MTKETIVKYNEESIEDHIKQIDFLHRIIEEREEWLKNIGSGNIDPFFSDEDAIKVGKTRENVTLNILSKEERLGQLRTQLNKLVAMEFILARDEKQERLNRIRELNEKGYLEAEIPEHYEKQLSQFLGKLDKDRFLKLAVEEIDNRLEVNDTPEERLKQARKNLDDFLAHLPENRHPDRLVHSWTNSWDFGVGENGDESLYKLFPRRLDNKNTSILTSTMNGLARAAKYGDECDEYPMNTKAQFMCMTIETIQTTKGVGEKKLTLIRLMKEIVQAEQDLGITE